MKLCLNSVTPRFIEIEKPDSTVLRYQVRLITMKQSALNEQKELELQKKLKDRKITGWDYYKALFEMALENFEASAFEDLTEDQLLQICELIGKIKQEKGVDEKKNREPQNLKS